MSDFLQFLFAGITTGAVYALVALGFVMIYNASQVINFAQGEFVMIGGMATFFLMGALAPGLGEGLGLPVATILAVGIAVVCGLLLEKLAIEPAQGASALPLTAVLAAAAALVLGQRFLADGMNPVVAVPLALAAGTAAGGLFHGLDRVFGEARRRSDIVSLIIITIGAAIFIRGTAEVVWDRNFHSLPAFSGNEPIPLAGAALNPQGLWVLGGGAVLLIAVAWFFNRTLTGKGMLATSHNRLAAQLVGINTRSVMLLAFALAAAIGAVGGILVAPISQTYSTVGVMLGLKGFAAAILGGLSSGLGAVVGGLVLGVVEALTAGYVSSAYKDAVAFILILGVLFFRPGGLFGKGGIERV